MQAAAHYEAYWNLSASPFTNHVEPRWLYQSPTHEEALSRLTFAAEQSRRAVLMVGPAGTGKSLILRALRHQWRGAARELAVLDRVPRTSRELLWELGEAFGLGLSASATTFAFWARLRDFVSGSVATHRPVFMAIDHATGSSDEVRETLERLLQLTGGGTGVTVLLTTRRGDDPALPEGFARNCDLRVRLEALDLRETHAYVRALMSAAGRSEEVFEHEALDEIHNLSRGVPRDINRLCDLALLAGCLEDAERVTESLVTAVAGEAMPAAVGARRYEAALVE
jgi:general secretion pathway protein A